MPLRFVMQPRFSLSIPIYGLQPLNHAQLFRLGADPLLVIPTLDLQSDATQGKACRQWNYTGSCSCDTASSSYSGHHKCRVCAKDHPMLHCAQRRTPIPEVHFTSSESS